MFNKKIAQALIAAMGTAAALQAPIAAACEKELRFPLQITSGVTCKDTLASGVVVASGDLYEGISLNNSNRYRATARLLLGSIAFTIIRDVNHRQINDCFAEDRNRSDSASGGKTCTANFVSQGAFVAAFALR